MYNVNFNISKRGRYVDTDGIDTDDTYSHTNMIFNNKMRRNDNKNRNMKEREKTYIEKDVLDFREIKAIHSLVRAKLRCHVLGGVRNTRKSIKSGQSQERIEGFLCAMKAIVCELNGSDSGINDSDNGTSIDRIENKTGVSKNNALVNEKDDAKFVSGDTGDLSLNRVLLMAKMHGIEKAILERTMDRLRLLKDV